jgi:hypothetical protein
MPVPPCFRRRSPALPTQPAGVERRNAAARGLLAIVGGAWLAAAMASDRVELQTTDHRLVTGRVVREAQDDSLLIEHDDGRYELLVKWQPTNAKDNSHSGHTGSTYIDAYRLDGSFMWRIDLGTAGENVVGMCHVSYMDRIA